MSQDRNGGETGKGRKAALHAHLKRAILTLALRPGSDLDETRLSEDFGLSRTPLREVLRDLAGDGYVELRENRGARVSEMSHTSLRDFFVAAPMIYGAVMRLAARHATPAQIADLADAQDAFRAALAGGSGIERALANNRFHEITGQMSGNVYLLPSFRRLLIDHVRISMTFYRPRSPELASIQTQASHQHDAIIAAIEAGDEDTAAALAGDHWALSRGRIELFAMPGGLDMPLGTAPEHQAG